jgi:antitoxin component of MazEF toxin-antitoxin module
MAKVCRWGNSLGLRLPKEIATSAGLRPGALVRVRLLDNGSIIVVPVAAAVAVTEAQTAVKPPAVAEKW